MTKQLLLFLGIVLSISLSAQEKYTISGYIRDASTGEELISANLFETTNGVGTVSNLYGFYSITLPKDSVYLNFSYIGYQSQSIGIYLDKDVTLNINLGESVELETVEIVATNAQKIEEKTEMSVIDVPIAQIKKIPALLGEVDVLKTLQLLPGVQSGGEGQSGLYVRGGSPDQNLILLDGVPVYNANHLFGFFSVFNADAIKDVKLTKGGFPARYGGRLSSVLEINMKEGNNQEYHGSASVGLISSKFTFEGPIVKNKASFIVSARRTYIDVLARPLISYGLRQEGAEGTFGYYFYDLNAKLNYRISDKDRLYLSAYTGDDKFYVSTVEEFSDGNFGKSEQSTKFNLGWGNITTAARWNHLWTNKLFSNVTATYSRYNFNTLIGSRSEDFNDAGEVVDGENLSANYDSGIDDLSLRVDFDYIPLPNHFVKFGAQGIMHKFNPGLFEINADITNNGVQGIALDTIFGQDIVNSLEYNAFIEDDYKITDYLKVNGGLHFSGFSLNNTNYTSLQPRISANFRLPNSYALKASFATMRQYVQYLTNENLGLPSDQWLPTTERIKPQDSWQVALGIAKTYGDQYEFSVEAYYKEMKNLIGYKEGASLFNLGDWQDQVTQGQGNSYGAEVFLQKKKGRLTGWVGYTLSWSNRQFDDKNFGNWYPFKFDRRHDLSIVGIYEISKRVSFAATWVYGTGNAITFAESLVPTVTDNQYGPSSGFIEYFKERNDFRMGDYHRLDVGFDFTRERKRYTRTWSIGAYNAYSRRNPFFLSRTTKYTTNPDGTAEREEVLRQYSLFPIIPSISYKIDF
ncbi:TonB-dependent receptor [Portibacter lacus]|uniref:TonB-dependent receptor n=1 Tax=Portibacter lacus TaxID=1099794 RepID=A0AA37SJB8_9BACT|nr:TonB-dependent receptor [Portibacter lacus]GLR15556.1 TonB-dependent receptor [Portibacter lacus]